METVTGTHLEHFWTFLLTLFREHNSKTIEGISTKLATLIKKEA